MAPRKRDLPIEELNPSAMEPTRENVEFARSVLAKLDNMRLAWGGTLAAWEKRLGLSTAITPPDDPVLEVIRQPRGTARPKPTEPVGPLKLIQGSMADLVYTIASDIPRPLTFRDLEDELRKRGHGDKITGNDRPHYGAVQRLRDKGYLRSHKGRFTTPGNMKKYLEDVAAGRTEDVFAPQLRNKWAEAILRFLEDLPDGATTQEMILHLYTLPEFAVETKGFHESYVYSIVAKLAKRDKLIEPCGTASGEDGKRRNAVVYRLRKSADGAVPTTDEVKATIRALRSNGAKASTSTTAH